MKINLIINEEDYNSTLDANILSFLFRKIKDKTEIKNINVNNFKCDNASINIFLGCINNVLLNHAKFNILIPNNQTFKRQDIPLLNNFDYILCKSKYTKTMFESHVPKEKIKYISWRSTDLCSTNIDKEFDSFMLYCYDSNYTQYKKIIESWKENYPKLYVVGFSSIKKSNNIIYHSNLNQNEFEKLFNTCGFHLCLNEIDSFSHNINQCALVKSVPIIINSSPMNEFIDGDNLYSLVGKKKKLNKYLGNKNVFSESSFESVIESIMKLEDTSLFENMGLRCRNDSLKNHSLNDSLFRETMKEIFTNLRKTSKQNNKIKDYPKISLVTLVHNRKEFFNLSVFNYNTSTYPKDKIEWIVYDTSTKEQCVEKLLPPKEEREKDNIRYIHDESIMSIGTKRNKAVELCSNDIVIFHDDDDFYYPKNISKRVEELIHSGKKIVGCTILGCFNINKCISFIESNPISNNIQDRISPASLGFYKSAWEKGKFTDESIGEAHNLILNNLSEFSEISWEDVIVSLVHKYNITNRITPNTQPNGNHYGFSKGLFKYLVELQNT